MQSNIKNLISLLSPSIQFSSLLIKNLMPFGQGRRVYFSLNNTWLLIDTQKSFYQSTTTKKSSSHLFFWKGKNSSFYYNFFIFVSVRISLCNSINLMGQPLDSTIFGVEKHVRRKSYFFYYFSAFLSLACHKGSNGPVSTEAWFFSLWIWISSSLFVTLFPLLAFYSK